MVSRTVTCPKCQQPVLHPGPQYVDRKVKCHGCGQINRLTADSLVECSDPAPKQDAPLQPPPVPKEEEKQSQNVVKSVAAEVFDQTMMGLRALVIYVVVGSVLVATTLGVFLVPNHITAVFSVLSFIFVFLIWRGQS